MIALGGPKLKPFVHPALPAASLVSMIALGGPKLKLWESLQQHAQEMFQ